MLRDRKEGVIYLHWCALTIAAVGTYAGWVLLEKGIHGFHGTNILLYLLGVVVSD